MKIEINEIENIKTVERMNTMRSHFYENNQQNWQSLARLNKDKSGKLRIPKSEIKLGTLLIVLHGFKGKRF